MLKADTVTYEEAIDSYVFSTLGILGTQSGRCSKYIPDRFPCLCPSEGICRN
jgi:hypothetical protein